MFILHNEEFYICFSQPWTSTEQYFIYEFSPYSNFFYITGYESLDPIFLL